jgi:hypothetical protein
VSSLGLQTNGKYGAIFGNFCSNNSGVTIWARDSTIIFGGCSIVTNSGAGFTVHAGQSQLRTGFFVQDGYITVGSGPGAALFANDFGVYWPSAVPYGVILTWDSIMYVSSYIWGSGSGANSYPIRMNTGARMIFDGGTTAAKMPLTGVLGTHVLMNNVTGAMAFNAASGSYNPAARSLSFTNIFATYDNGGFDGNVTDPRYPCKILMG